MRKEGADFFPHLIWFICEIISNPEKEESDKIGTKHVVSIDTHFIYLAISFCTSSISQKSNEKIKSSNVCQITRSPIYWNLIYYFFCCCNENHTEISENLIKYFICDQLSTKKRNYQTTYKTREKNSKNCGRKIPWNWWQQKFIIKLVGIHFVLLIDMKHWHVSKNTFPNDFSHFWSNQNKYFFFRWFHRF